ncbi:hypothetical protein M2H39_17870, partial [Vibrio vulnificus]|nr:hypothetical protein [Vibrio vulnificus]
SNLFLTTSVCQPLSILFLVILAKAGIHRTASVVARYYRFVTGIVVGFAPCSCWLWRVYFQTRHPVRVAVCTGMTTGVVARYDEISVSATFLEVLIHFYFPNLNSYIEYRTVKMSFKIK